MAPPFFIRVARDFCTVVLLGLVFLLPAINHAPTWLVVRRLSGCPPRPAPPQLYTPTPTSDYRPRASLFPGGPRRTIAGLSDAHFERLQEGIVSGEGEVMCQGRVPVVPGCSGAGDLEKGPAFLVSVEWVNRPGSPPGDSRVDGGGCLTPPAGEALPHGMLRP